MFTSHIKQQYDQELFSLLAVLLWKLLKFIYDAFLWFPIGGSFKSALILGTPFELWDHSHANPSLLFDHLLNVLFTCYKFLCSLNEDKSFAFIALFISFCHVCLRCWAKIHTESFTFLLKVLTWAKPFQWKNWPCCIFCLCLRLGINQVEVTLKQFFVFFLQLLFYLYLIALYNSLRLYSLFSCIQLLYWDTSCLSWFYYCWPKFLFFFFSQYCWAWGIWNWQYEISHEWVLAIGHCRWFHGRNNWRNRSREHGMMISFMQRVVCVAI